MVEAELTQAELDERVRILKRFRELLEQQRNKFREYLSVLEKQTDAIEADNTDALVAHAELEQQIVANIGNLQKVIAPMEILYKEKNSQLAGDSASIPELQTDLIHLQQEVLSRNKYNCELLKLHMAEIKNRIQTQAKFNPYRNAHSVYAFTGRASSATMVNIQG